MDRDHKMTLEQTQQLFDFLIGANPPNGIRLRKRPRKMTAEQALSIVYLLQEVFHVIPDIFEKCSHCGWLFDTEHEGHIPDDTDKCFCSNCSRLCQCENCLEEGE
jgi:hypothetical protein